MRQNSCVNHKNRSGTEVAQNQANTSLLSCKVQALMHLAKGNQGLPQTFYENGKCYRSFQKTEIIGSTGIKKTLVKQLQKCWSFKMLVN